MTPSKLTDFLKKNTRQYETPLRDIERRLAEATNHELAIEQEIAARLAEIAGMQVDGHAELCSDARHQLKLRADEEQSMRDQLHTVEQGIVALMQNTAAAREAVNQAKAKVREMLSDDAEFLEVADEHDAAAATHKLLLVSYGDTVLECKRKLPAYEQDPLHQYLVGREYGTPQYKRTGIVRYLDRWIANLCNFDANRPNEMMLRTMLESIETGSRERVERLTVLRANLDARVAVVEKANDIEGLQHRVAKLEKDTEAQKKRANSIHAKLDEYAEKRDVRYVKARELMAAFLRTETPAELTRRVSLTPDTADDDLAREVMTLQQKLKEHKTAYSDLHAARAAAEKDYQRAKNLERELRSNSYTSSRYEYSRGLDLSDLVVGYMAGRMSLDSATAQVRQHRQEVEEYTYPTSSRSSSSTSSSGWSSSRSSSSWSSSSSDSSSSDSFSSSSSFGSDSYSTSDSF